MTDDIAPRSRAEPGAATPRPLDEVRATVSTRLLAAAAADARVLAVLDYGSSSERRGDRWSDLDLVVAVRDADAAAFRSGWRDWVVGFGDLLLTYAGGGVHPRAVYDAEPVALRLDLGIYPRSEVAALGWATVPPDVAAMVRYESTAADGEFSRLARARMAAVRSAPALPADRDEAAGDLWYYLLRIYGLARRGDALAARTEFDWFVLNNLAALTRLATGRTERWKTRLAVARIEHEVDPALVTRLEGCVPGPSPAGLARAGHAAARLGLELCAALGADAVLALGRRVEQAWRELAASDAGT